MSDHGTLERIASHLVAALAPLDRAFRDEETFRTLMLQLGWNARGLPPSYVAVADAVIVATGALADLADGAELDEVLAVIDAVGRVYRDATALSEAPQGVDIATFLPELASRLIEYLLVEHLRTEVPRSFRTLDLLGVIRMEHHLPEGDRPGFTRTLFDWDSIPSILADPRSVATLVYGWGGADLALDALFPLLEELAIALGLLTSLDLLSAEDSAALQVGATGPPEREARLGLTVTLLEIPLGDGAAAELGLQLREIPAEGQALPGLILAPAVPSEVARALEFGNGWTFTVRAGTDVSRQLGIVLRPDGLSVRFPGATGGQLPTAGFGVTLARDAGEPRPVFGQPGGSRLELRGVETGCDLKLHDGELELALEGAAHGLAMVVTAGESDGFLASVLGDEELRVDVPLALRWSSRTGLDARIGTGFAVSVHPSFDVGFVRFDRVDLAVGVAVDDPPALQVGAAVAISGTVGPFSYSVDRLGVELSVLFAEGNAGPFDVRLQPLLPKGLGLAIDTPAVSGGGFLLLDHEAGRYAGVFELTIVETVSVKVIGIITTKLPDGSPGFALLLMITADGFAPVQLGMGFVLTGIGGLIALNRTIDVDAVRGGLSSGVLDSVLFAKDPVANASQIIATLDRIFPMAPDRLLIGPLAEIGWGSPPVVRIRLALLLEIPQPLRVVLLAALSLVLPDEEHPVVEVHVDAIGVLDLARGELALDASLHHSRLWKFALSGDMALRLNWGSEPQFLVSIGGFHPRYPAPAGLRSLQRLAISLSDSDNPLVRLEMYMALTSNTIQLGARVQVRAEFGGFGVDGGGAFDALVQWAPFGLDVSFEAWVRIFSPFGTLLAARLALQVTGSQPWHVAGTASLQILFFSVEVSVDLTIGDPQPPPPLETVDVAQLIWDELTMPESWSAALGDGIPAGVTLGAVAGTEEATVVHPLATVTARQKIAPLATSISRMGALLPREGTRRYELDVDVPPGIIARPVSEQFAAAQYQEQPDAEAKLRAPAFTPLPAGVALTPATAAAFPVDAALTTDLVFETWTWSPSMPRPPRRRTGPRRLP